METERHVTSSSGLRKFQAAWFVVEQKVPSHKVSWGLHSSNIFSHIIS